MEQGIREDDTVLFRFKFFNFYDLNPKVTYVVFLSTPVYICEDFVGLNQYLTHRSEAPCSPGIEN